MSADVRVLLVGLDNPQSRDPRYALFPRPAGCAGARLFAMMKLAAPDFTEREYVNIPKTNLFPVGKAPTEKKLRYGAGMLLAKQLADSGIRVVLLGVPVRDALFGSMNALAPNDEGVFATLVGTHYAWIPHPREYISKRMQKKVGQFLVELIRSSK